MTSPGLPVEISPVLRDDLLTYLFCTSFCTSLDRARIIGELTSRNPSMADLLIELEADDDLRAMLEIVPLRGTSFSD